MLKQIISLIVFLFSFILYAQDCDKINDQIDTDYSYTNKEENISMPFNKDWSILKGNEKALLVAMGEKNSLGYFSLIKNKNQIPIGNAHIFTEKMITSFLNRIVPHFILESSNKTFLKNLKAIEVQFKYDVKNLNETTQVQGLIYMIVKDEYTFIFMFNCQPQMKSCFFPFYKQVLKSTFFGQEWY